MDANHAVDFVDGRYSEAALATWEAHIADCGDCRALLVELARSRTASHASHRTMHCAIGGTLAPIGEAVTELEPGAHIGRYTVLAPLGRGGMGIVYRAHDPDLARTVALKLVRVAGNAGDTGDVRKHLLLEARALAKLAHPNVVAVYDVGTTARRDSCEEIFIAMELVEGQTLDAWLHRQERDTDEVIAVMLAAGRGLAAAHAANLVHRDFKPSNVIIGEDGRVRVLDFGLVHADEGVLDSADSSLDESLRASLDKSQDASQDANDSRPAGEDHYVLGTPAYMSPEQYCGTALGPATDQFSFCVTLYQSLCRTHPFGDASSGRRARVLAGKLTPPPRSNVPSRLLRTLRRGLSVNVADRFSSMEKLLGDITSQRPARTRRRRLVALTVAAGGIAAAGLLLGTRAQSRTGALTCTSGVKQLEAAWGTAQKSRLGDIYAQAQVPRFQRIAATLNDYSTRWVAMSNGSCRATWIDGVQSEAALDLRTRCLARRKGELAALVEELGHAPDAESSWRALTSGDVLGDLALCADTETLARVMPRPASPARRKQIDESEKGIADVAAMAALGRYEAASKRLESTREHLEGLQYPPTRAAFEYQQGRLLVLQAQFPAAEAALKRARLLAARSRADVLEAKIQIELLWAVGNQARFDESLAMTDSARAAVARAGSPLALRAALLHNVAGVSLVAGKRAEAAKAFEQALALREQAFGANSRHAGATLLNLALAYRMLGRTDDAEAATRRALTILRARLGEEHPNVATAYNSLASILLDTERFDAALKAAQSALTIRRSALGADHPHTAGAGERVGTVLMRLEQYKRARPYLESALATKVARLGDNHPSVANVHAVLGDLEYKLGDMSRARDHVQRAYEIRLARFGPAHGAVLAMRLRLAEFAERNADRTAAHTQFATLAKDVRDKNEPLVEAAALFGLARTSRGNRRATKLARKARAIFAAAGPTGKSEVAKVDGWLKTDGRR